MVSLSCAVTEYIILSAQQYIEEVMTSGISLAMKWFPRHIILCGNEKADQVAKEEIMLSRPIDRTPCRRATATIDTVISQTVMLPRRHKAEGKMWQMLFSRENANGFTPDDIYWPFQSGYETQIFM